MFTAVTGMDPPDNPLLKRKRISFTADEDERLRFLIATYGEDNWRLISEKMVRREPRQCRERWINYLSPTVANGPWSAEEEDRLCAKVRELGHRWKAMEPFFPGRTDINIKNRWKQIQKLGHDQPPPEMPHNDPFVHLSECWEEQKSDAFTQERPADQSAMPQLW
jgi:hypothetical protein